MPYKKEPPLYSTWKSMKQRCLMKKSKAYKDYGARGITICERWMTYKNFEVDMLPRPIGTSLDRIDNDLGYFPANCRWSTKQEQQRNRRINVKVTIEGVEYLAVALAEIAGLKTETIVLRAKFNPTLKQILSKDASFRKLASIKRFSNKTHCPQGHSYQEKGGLTKNGWRFCKECHRLRQAVVNKSISEAAKAVKSA